MLRRDLSLTCVVLMVWATNSSAAPAVISPSIGVISATGAMLVNRSTVWGNATLFSGTAVETSEASGNLALTNGVRMQMAAQSRASIFESHAVLEKGSTQVANTLANRKAYVVETSGLKIAGDAGSRMRVALTTDGRVEVASLNGTTNVRNETGVLLAAIPAGTGLSFGFQGAGTTTTRTGCLLYKSNRFILRDDNTSEVIEVSGTGLGPNVGNHVEVTGSVSNTRPVVTIATLAMNVTNLTLKTSGGCLTVASDLDASATPPATTPASAAPTQAATKGGLSTGAKIGIAVAVIGGGAGAALAVSSGKKSSTSQ
jgi:hypothetical protein